MKILSLHLKNINSFRGEEYIDFEAEPLLNSPLFAITGPTGSGKTTILDAISVALYNKTPRLDGNGNKSPANLLSQGADEGFVEVVFSVDGSRYLSEWRAKRKKNGEIKTEVKLINHDTGKPITNRGKGKGKQDMAGMSVEDAVSKILGIDFVAFKRSILLAQGEFASFLKADAEKKREILEATTGMGIYELLKDTLNQQVKQVKTGYEVAGAGMEGIPAVTLEQIEAVKVELESIEKKLLKLGESKAALEKEKEIEQRRTDAQRKLLENRKEQQLLQSRKEEIENIKREIELADKAADIRSEMDSYSSQKEQLENLRSQQVEITKEVEESEKGFSSAKSEHKTSAQEFENAKIKAEGKRKVYDEASTIETRSKELLGESVKKHTEANPIREKVRQVEDIIRQKKEEMSALGKASDAASEFLEKNPLPEAPEDVLSKASETAAINREMEKTLLDRKASLKKTQSEIKELDNELNKLTIEANSINTKKSIILTKLETNRNALEPLISGGASDYWGIVKFAWGELQAAGSKFNEQYDSLSRLLSVEATAGSGKKFLSTLNLFNEKIGKLALEITVSEERVKRFEAEEKLVTVTHQAVILRGEYLTEGTPCPVCGSGEHPWAGKIEHRIEEEIGIAHENVKNAKSAIESLKRKLDETFQELSLISKNMVVECEKIIGKIELLLKERTEAENELKLVAQQAEANTSHFESMEHQKEKLDGDKHTIVAGMEALECEMKDNRSFFITLMPPAFSSESTDSALTKFRTLISTARKHVRELEENKHKISACSNSIQENSERLMDENQRFNTLLESAKQYEADGNKLIVQALEMTGGIGTNAARIALAAHLETMETRFNNLRLRYNDSKDTLTRSEEKLRGIETEFIRSSEKLDKAQLIYMKALGSSGFASIEEHKSAFREPELQGQNKQFIKQYEKEVHTTEENIKTHESMFAEKPYVPEDLMDILEREKVLVKSIEETNSIKGGMLKNIETLTENLNKRQEQEKKLESTRKEMERWQKLLEVMPANSLRDFALKTMFDLLIRFANHQLSDITARYALKAVDMKDMVVIDRWNAGEERPVETLSGGESFLVSLSLALALSELSKGRSKLESLFLDEGFGTLDPETLESALCALESLRLSGRTIGVISHIDQLTRRIPVRIEVRKTGNGSSKISVMG